LSEPFDDLIAVTDAIYQADLARLRSITGEEDQLRNELAKLKDEECRNAAADPALRQIGGDILWKAWMGRKREALNLQLATVMARKLGAIQALRRSFGKTSVAEELRDRARETGKGAKAMRTLVKEQNLLVLKASTNR